jgi:hypothetical protein
LKEVLLGWGEIAQYIGRSISTAQRYERTLGLPVRRREKGPKAPVYAREADLRAWMLGPGSEHVKSDLLEAHGQHPNLFSSSDQALKAHVIDRIHALTNLTLYRRNYHMHFDLKPSNRGVRVNIAIEFELLNASNMNQPYVQLITLDDSDHGHVKEMAVLKNSVFIYALKDVPAAERELGYSVYRGNKLMIEPENSGVSYVCRSLWVINRGEYDLWYDHMALPTVGVSVDTHAPPEYEITPSFSTSNLISTAEHLDIAWKRRK